jgi:hypothetical protein
MAEASKSPDGRAQTVRNFSRPYSSRPASFAAAMTLPAGQTVSPLCIHEVRELKGQAAGTAC